MPGGVACVVTENRKSWQVYRICREQSKCRPSDALLRCRAGCTIKSTRPWTSAPSTRMCTSVEVQVLRDPAGGMLHGKTLLPHAAIGPMRCSNKQQAPNVRSKRTH